MIRFMNLKAAYHGVIGGATGFHPRQASHEPIQGYQLGPPDRLAEEPFVSGQSFPG